MSNKGDDCYFYYYSTCTKGDGCPFRHCEAAMGSETVCNLWQENRCFRNLCKFRHMEIDKNRKEIPCYWENQPGGCQKLHCAFHHEKPRMIGGLYVPPDKGPVVRKEKEEESPHDDRVVSAPALIASNPQRRGLLKTETQESVPSPTHPPVVINSLDDEDDEDDQVSEDGGEAGVSPRKLINSSKEDSLNFGVQTLEEIRLRKALKASLKASERPWLLNSDELTSQNNKGDGTEKENIRSLKKPSLVTNKCESARLENLGKRKLTDRLGKRKNREDISVESDLQLKESLANRLGGFVETPLNDSDVPPQKDLKPVRERLGKNPDLAESKSPDSEPKATGEIRIKTLEEIRHEKAAKSQIQLKCTNVVTDGKAATSQAKRGIRNVSGPHVKTFSEIQREKRKLQEKKSATAEVSASPEGSDGVTNAKVIKVAVQASEVRVKTLAEIRKEKAARMQAPAQETTSEKSTSDGVPKKRILRIGLETASKSISPKLSQDSEKKVNPVPETVGKSESLSQAITVKSFEEIMREKKLRKQQEEHSMQQPPAHKPNVALSKDKPPAGIKARINAPTAASESTEQAKPPVHQRLGLRISSAPDPVVSPHQQAKESSPTTAPQKLKQSPSPAPSVATAEVTAAVDGDSEDLSEKKQTAPKNSPSNAVEMKVRPKLNVKPSVMKPAAQVKPGQKRKAAGSHCSAVAAVKPLNAAVPAEAEAPSEKTELPANSQQMPPPDQCGVIRSSHTTTSATESPSVPKSPVIKTPAQTRARRSSVVSGRDSAPSGNNSMVDDFEDLLDEFADDRLDDEIELDPGKGEDDLLLELSEMIDG